MAITPVPVGKCQFIFRYGKGFGDRDVVHSTDLRALKEFKKDYPAAKCFFFYGGPMAQYFEDVTVVPVQQALLGLDKILENGVD